MVGSLRRLALGFVLMAAAAGVLLLSDMGSRTSAKAGEKNGPSGRKMRVAVLQHASQIIMEQGRAGVFSGLAERGWVEGRNLELKLYNAEGDMAVAQTIASEMAGGGYDLLITLTTVSLQVVANANKTGRTPHVFALVSDPYVAGVGINRENHLDHPAHLAGYGTMQPIAQAFKTAREVNPALASVGVVWNAAEANSEAQVKLARQVCAELGITLMESTVDNTAGVAEAAGALVARGAEALWVGGDVTVLTAVDTVIAVARKGGIPVFTVIPPNVKRGALFDLGADYTEVGRLTGNLAGEILSGRSPATVPVENVMPEVLAVNQKATEGLKAKWVFPEAMLQRAQTVIDKEGKERSTKAKAPPAAIANPSGKKWRIAVVNYLESTLAEETLAGMADAWKRSALVAGKDYEVKVRSAQGDIAILNGIYDAALTEGVDIVVPMATPSLQAAIRKVRDVPVVFCMIANPIAAGAGKSYTDHLPNITGVSVLAPVVESLDIIQKHFPSYRRFGTLFCPAETNSVDLKESLESLCRQRGLTLEAVAVNSISELPDAALSLASRPIDVIVQVSDNISTAGFNVIAKAARQAQKPLISLNSMTVASGAPIAIGRDYHNNGEAAVGMIERIIRGEKPADMPFILPPKLFRSVSPANARAVGMTLPPELLKEVDKVIE